MSTSHGQCRLKLDPKMNVINYLKGELLRVGGGMRCHLFIERLTFGGSLVVSLYEMNEWVTIGC